MSEKELEFKKWWKENEDAFEDVHTSTAKYFWIAGVTFLEKENLELRALVNFARACFVEQEYPTDIEKEWLSKAEKYKQGE